MDPLEDLFSEPECLMCHKNMKQQGLMYTCGCGFSAPPEVAKGFKRNSNDFSKLFGGLVGSDVFGGL